MVVRIGICRGSNEAGLLGTQDCAGMPAELLGAGEQWEGREAATLWIALNSRQRSLFLTL